MQREQLLRLFSNITTAPNISTLQDLPRYDDQPWSGKPPLQSDSQSVETEPTLVIVTIIATESTSSIFKDNGNPDSVGDPENGAADLENGTERLRAPSLRVRERERT